MKSIKLKTVLTQTFEKKKAMNKSLSKYIAAFDYIDKTLIVLSEEEYLLFLM